MTVDEIRARWAGIDSDSLWDWDHKDLRKQVEHGVIDIAYLLTENTRLRTALALREELYNAAVWVGYYESDRKRAEYRAAVRRAREIVDRMGEALAEGAVTVREITHDEQD